MQEVISVQQRQLGKSLREDVEVISGLRGELEQRIRQEARTSGEKVAAGTIARWLVMAACGEVVLRWHPEVGEELRRGGGGIAAVDSFRSIGSETGRNGKTIARWLDKARQVRAAGGSKDFWQLKIGDLIERWEASLLREDLKSFDIEISDGPEPQLYVGRAESLNFLSDESIDIIITSPPYNLGAEKWPMGGITDPTNEGRKSREDGIGYSDMMPEKNYQEWQIECLKELYRVAQKGASFFYNHKVRQNKGQIIHPLDWLRKSPWIIRQEIIWDRVSTHNHCAQLFWPIDERIYWLTKEKPNLPDRPIGIPTVWRIFGPIPSTWHPAPFTQNLPKRCLDAIGWPGAIVLDPFGGSMTTCYVAQKMGYQSIGVDNQSDFIEEAKRYFGWSIAR